MSQHRNQTEQASLNASAYSGPTFQRPTPHGSTAYEAGQASDLRQQMQAQRPAQPDYASAHTPMQTASQPQPLAAGGQGPLSRAWQPETHTQTQRAGTQI